MKELRQLLDRMRVLVDFTINLIGECAFRSRSIPRPTGLRFWQTTLSFIKVPRTITSPHPSILPNTDLIKGDAFEFCESTVTTNLRPLKANHALDVADR
jgi:hypothetical protein